jgi:hypothetical protein
MSSDEQAVKVSVDNLQADHLLAFHQTLGCILSTTLAERTFAQIIDGLSTRDDVGFFSTYSIGFVIILSRPQRQWKLQEVSENTSIQTSCS